MSDALEIIQETIDDLELIAGKSLEDQDYTAWSIQQIKIQAYRELLDLLK